MKKVVNLTILVLLFVQFAMAKGENKIAQRKDVFVNSVWNGKDSFQFSYNQDTMQNLLLALKWDNVNLWGGNYKYTTQYSATKKVTEQIRENWNGSSWVKFTQYMYSYDVNDNLTLIQYNTWNGTSWNPAGKIVYSNYNQVGKFGKEEVFNWNGTTWLNFTYTTYSYPASSVKLSDKESYYWDNTLGWKKDERFFYDYNQDSVSIITHLYPDTSNQWVSDKRYLYNYNANPFRLNEYRVQKWDTSVSNPFWVDENRISYFYTSSGLVEKSLTEIYDGTSTWFPVSRMQNIYNVSDELIETFNESYNGTWSNSTRQTFQLTNANLIEEIYYLGSGSVWNVQKKISYNYNANDDVTFKQQDLFSGTYTPDFREFYYYKSTSPSGVNNVIKTLTKATLYPNPANEELRLHVSTSNSFQLSLSIIDLKGTLLTNMMLPLRDGEQTLDIPIAKLSNGHYLLQLTNLNTGENQTLKFTIAK